MKNLIKISLAACLMLAFNSVQALNVNGIEFNSGDTLMGGFVVEGTATSNGGSPITGTGQELVGINKVNAISNETFVDTWVSGQNGVELWVVFDGFIAEYIVPSALGADIGFSGGQATYYVIPAGTTVDLSGGFSGASSNIMTAAIGDPWLTTDAHGFKTCAELSQTCLNGDNTEITLFSNIIGALTDISAGSGFGLLDVTGGDAADYLDTNRALDGADIQLGSDFSSNQEGEFAASGTLDFKIFPVPEPGMLSLFGLGLLGMVGFRRRNA